MSDGEKYQLKTDETGTDAIHVEVKPDPPQFYIKRNGEEVPVIGMEGLLPEECPHDEVVTNKNGKSSKKRVGSSTPVYYRENNKEIVLGKTYTLQGCQGLLSVTGTSLYTLLIKGISSYSLTDRQKRIFAAIYNSEGPTKAVNSYDSAFLSFGPIQKTMGVKDAKGELPASLAYVKSNDPQTYQDMLGQFGIEPIEVTGNIGCCKIDGTPIKTASEKEEYRKFKWAYYLIKAMDNQQFASLFLEHNFKRIQTIESLSYKNDGKTIQFYDIFKTEAAHALVLDAHINYPVLATGTAKVKPMWITAVENVDSVNQKLKNDDLTNITQEEEISLIKELVQIRKNSKMTDGTVRTAYIVLCIKNIQNDEELIKKLGYADKATLLKEADPKVDRTSAFLDFLGISRGESVSGSTIGS